MDTGVLAGAWALGFVTAPSRELDLGPEHNRRLDLPTRSLLAAGVVFSAIAGSHSLGGLLYCSRRCVPRGCTRVKRFGTSPRGVLVRVGI